MAAVHSHGPAAESHQPGRPPARPRPRPSRPSVGASYLGLPSCDSLPQAGSFCHLGMGISKSHSGSFRPRSGLRFACPGGPPAPAERRRDLRLGLMAAQPPAWGTPLGTCTKGSRGLMGWACHFLGRTPALEPCWPGAALWGCPCYHTGTQGPRHHCHSGHLPSGHFRGAEAAVTNW